MISSPFLDLPVRQHVAKKTYYERVNRVKKSRDPGLCSGFSFIEKIIPRGLPGKSLGIMVHGILA